jgi:predicted DNA-binding transcriptional regulator AlpA
MREPRTPPSGPDREPGEAAIALGVSEQLLDALADRVARRVLSRLEPPEQASPWLDVEGALEFLPFTRDQLYKLTSARAIPFRKKRGGQGLLFHRGELEAWLEAEYEPTGCAGEVELWSSTDQ